VVAEARAARVDALVLGGDVALGPLPSETLQYLLGLDLPLHCVRGNCDRGMLESLQGEIRDRMPAAARECLRWAANRLSAEMLDWMRSWPLTAQLGDVLFCHATPRDDNEIFVASTPEAAVAPSFAGCPACTVVCGHTHMQFDRQVVGIRVWNAGSVGMPFGAPGADWLLVGDRIEFRHTAYDLEAAARLVRNTQYPAAQQFAEQGILQPRNAAEMEHAFLEIGLR